MEGNSRRTHLSDGRLQDFARGAAHPQLIALVGPSNVGKSTTMQGLRALLIQQGWSCNDRTPRSLFPRKDGVYVMTKDHLTVGIITAGDTLDVLRAGLLRLDNCSVVACAVRTRGAAYNHVLEASLLPPLLVHKARSSASDFEAQNAADVKTMASAIALLLAASQSIARGSDRAS